MIHKEVPTITPTAFSKTRKRPTFEAMAAVMTTSSDSVKVFTELAISQFVKIYEDVKKKHGFDGPNADKLHQMIMNEVFSMSTPITKDREMNDEQPKTEKPEPAQVEEPVQVEEPAQVEEETPVVEPTAPPAATKKLDSKMLKKIVVKETKTNKKGETVVSDKVIDMPYLPHCVDYSNTCQALSLSGGLYTPCLTRPVKGSNFCKSCEKCEFKYGKIGDRETVNMGEYVDPSGKKEISWGTWLSRRDMSRETVEALIQEAVGDAIVIPDSYYDVDKKKSKRYARKTSPSVSSDNEETSSVESDGSQGKKKRGRPAKKAAAEPPKDGEGEEASKKKRGRPAKKVEEKPEPTPAENIPVAESDEESDEMLDELLGDVEEEEAEEPVTVTEQQEDKIRFLEKNPENDMMVAVFKGETYNIDSDNDVYTHDEEGGWVQVGTYDPEDKAINFTEV